MPYDLCGNFYASARDAANAEMAQCAAIDANIAAQKVAELEARLYQAQQEAAYHEQQKQQYGYWQLCPKCNGQGSVLYPPYLPAGVTEFSSAQTQWVCDVCNGAKILARPIINQETITP